VLLRPIRVVLVHAEQGRLHCYVVCEPANNYYGIMTKSAGMPSLMDGMKLQNPLAG
jgi:hypothetical protein